MLSSWSQIDVMSASEGRKQGREALAFTPRKQRNFSMGGAMAANELEV